MGYSFCAKLTTEDKFFEKDEFMEIYNKSEVLPELAVETHSTGGGLGTGFREKFQDELCGITLQFPDTTFHLYLYYWDLTNLDIYKIKGRVIEKIYHKDIEEIKTPLQSVYAHFSVDTEFDNELSDFYEPVDLIASSGRQKVKAL